MLPSCRYLFIFDTSFNPKGGHWGQRWFFSGILYAIFYYDVNKNLIFPLGRRKLLAVQLNERTTRGEGLSKGDSEAKGHRERNVRKSFEVFVF